LDPEINRQDEDQEVPAETPKEEEATGTARVTWSDTRLVRECLNGNEDAWAALIEKYKRLIYSIPIKYGASQDDAADIFQAVCLELFSELQNLRKAESIKSWLITVTSHQAFHWKKRQRRSDVELDDTSEDKEPIEIASTEALPPQILEEVQQEQMVREGISRLNARCAQMMRLLFYENPPLPYNEVARRLGLATGSIGFIRGRCLKRLQKILDEMGF
jgi:RNA polymerase sigma factor (sigma-70 family)